MKVTLRGTRGSVASPQDGNSRYGGNTSCVEVEATPGALLVLDAGTGARHIRSLEGISRVDVLLTHLHMDHIVGLGFFPAFFQPDLDVHVWGPPSTVESLHGRLSRYLSPPLFPVRLRDLPCRLSLHDTPRGSFEVPGASVVADLVCHPGATLGYRLTGEGATTVAYLPDHEPALGVPNFPGCPGWTSGFDLVAGVDLLIHDAQYSNEEYPSRVGWGHSSLGQAMALAARAGVSRLVAFHHDPDHDDSFLDDLYAGAGVHHRSFDLYPAREGDTYELGRES